MVRPINRNILILGKPSVAATKADISIGDDLLETLNAHAHECVGMAANMIGINKRIIAFADDGKYTVMLNPEIIRRSDPYETEEGCLFRLLVFMLCQSTEDWNTTEGQCGCPVVYSASGASTVLSATASTTARRSSDATSCTGALSATLPFPP